MEVSRIALRDAKGAVASEPVERNSWPEDQIWLQNKCTLICKHQVLSEFEFSAKASAGLRSLRSPQAQCLPCSVHLWV